MSKELLETFARLRAEIEEAIPADNAELLKSLDNKIYQNWEDILSYQPRNREERVELAVFLIDQIQPNQMSDTILAQIRNKLMEIVS